MSKQLSVIVPLLGKVTNDVTALHQAYASALASTPLQNIEFIYINSPENEHFTDTLASQSTDTVPVKVVEMARNFGESIAISVGAENAQYETLLTLPSYEQVTSASLADMLSELENHDMVMVKRSERIDSTVRQIPSRVLRFLVSKFTDAPFADASCGVRLFKKNILDEVNLYGDLHRFFSILAYEKGFRIKLLDLPQAESDASSFSSVFTYLRHSLDVLAVLFLTKFNKRPLRFFGSIGTTSLIIGSLGLAIVGIQRIVFEMSAADRPLIILLVLLVALGCQLIAIGLVGESFIFTHGKTVKEYKIRKIHQQ